MGWDADSIDFSLMFKDKKLFSSFLNFILPVRLLYIRHWLHYYRCFGFLYIVR